MGGTFQKGQSGNPSGRPAGSRNKATLALDALLDGEGEAITRKAIELAKAATDRHWCCPLMFVGVVPVGISQGRFCPLFIYLGLTRPCPSGKTYWSCLGTERDVPKVMTKAAVHVNVIHMS
jgi:hypothetical protein